MDRVFVSRLQFGLTLAFHYLFVPLTIGLGVALVAMEGLYLRTRQAVHKDMTKCWAGIFGLDFGLGVATGIRNEASGLWRTAATGADHDSFQPSYII